VNKILPKTSYAAAWALELGFYVIYDKVYTEEGGSFRLE
jgi:hypothetical protein